ncbi:MAG: PEP-CTERM sorting domain-containing protein [Pirellulaceae bacterium]
MNTIRFSLCCLLASVLAEAGSGRLGAAVLRPGDIVAVALQAVFRVDPVTGDRTIISDNATGSGPAFAFLSNVVVEATGNIFLTDRGDGDTVARILEVDPATGDRRLVAGNGVGTTPQEFAVPVDIVVEPEGTLLVLDGGRNVVFRVDPRTGDRVILSGMDNGGGAPFPDVESLAVDSSGAIYVGADEGPPLFQVEALTGDRTIIPDGTGPRVDVGEAIAIGAGGDLLVVAGVGADDGILRVDPVTGNRQIVTGGAVGSGPIFEIVSAIDRDERENIFVAEWNAQAIFHVDPATGNRTILSSSTVGSGPAMGSLRALAVVPVPEPSALALVLSGLSSVLAATAARKRWALRGSGSQKLSRGCQRDLATLWGKCNTSAV